MMLNKGPLAGIKVVELAGLAPGPLCGMVLSDFGAKVIKVDRTHGHHPHSDRAMRGKLSIALDLKKSAGIGILRKLCLKSDVLIDPYRPGILEKMGIGPNVLLSENPRFIIARLSGFGQTGPWAQMAGHDINYVALSGLLSMLGRKNEKPYAPLNLIADFGGGGLACALGILMALFEREKSGRGQVVDMSMAEGAAYLGAWIYKSQDMAFLWGNKRGENLLDSGYPLYEVYETKDGKFMSVGALEPQFQKVFLEKIELTKELSAEKILSEPEESKGIIQTKFLEKSREEWSAIFAGTDACTVPVLELSEAPQHAQHVARKAFEKNDSEKDGGVGWEPRPAPKLSRSPANPSFGNPDIGENTEEILAELGLESVEIRKLITEGVVGSIKKTESKL